MPSPRLHLPPEPTTTAGNINGQQQSTTATYYRTSSVTLPMSKTRSPSSDGSNSTTAASIVRPSTSPPRESQLDQLRRDDREASHLVSQSLRGVLGLFAHTDSTAEGDESNGGVKRLGAYYKKNVQVPVVQRRSTSQHTPRRTTEE